MFTISKGITRSILKEIMKSIILLTCFFFCVNLQLISQSKAELKEIILNKKNNIPANWVNLIQNQVAWEFQKAVTTKRKKVKDHYLDINGTIFNFENARVVVTPFHHKVNQVEYSDLDAVYYTSNNTIVISTDVQNGNRTINKKTVFKVINLTKEYLILEEIKDIYCFDFSSGRILTKKECKAKAQNESKKLFGGKEINIGKSVNRKLVLKAKK